ncbi:MAG: SigB/SigF/SigG family RNA polymerase sigma factor [Carbonactinosporaceae bacterium]
MPDVPRGTRHVRYAERPPPPEGAGESQPSAEELLQQLAELPQGDPRRAALRDRVIEMHLPQARSIAARYQYRGEPVDDLVQVATIGLIKAVDGYDPRHGTLFLTYAMPMMFGEVKRHFRDKAWVVRVPRDVQELSLQLTAAVPQLTQELGRSPTVSELAGHLVVTGEQVLEAKEAADAYSTLSLDEPATRENQRVTIADSLPSEDPAYDMVLDRESLRPLLEALPEREKRIVLMRFFTEMSQSQIAEVIGISQMHVSRLLARTCAQLREGILDAREESGA